uniref:CSON003738 protein n=1 Tax=Culicoides sonorensis TaxID=179676 RepID=A0A336LDA7_CULSO
MSREYDADSVHSMNRSPPPTNGSPKASFLSNGGSPTNNNNSDNEEFKPPSYLNSIPKKPRERYWGVTNVEADTGGEWVIGHTDPNFTGFDESGDTPPLSPKMDDVSEVSSQMPVQAPPPEAINATMIRSKSRTDLNGPLKAGKQAQKYNNLSFWKARKITFYKNGDAFYPGFEFIFKPGRDIATMEILLDKLTKKMDLPRGARFIYDMTGDKKTNLDDLEDGASYVVSAFKGFKDLDLNGYFKVIDHLFEEITRKLMEFDVI